MIVVPDPIELVTKIRKAATERNLSLNDIVSLMKEKGEYPVAPATLSRLLSGDEEEANYNYLKTIIPVYNTLFDIDDVSDDNEKMSAMKSCHSFFYLIAYFAIGSDKLLYTNIEMRICKINNNQPDNCTDNDGKYPNIGQTV